MCSRKWSLLNSMELILCKPSLFMISRRMLSLVLVFFFVYKKYGRWGDLLPHKCYNFFMEQVNFDYLIVWYTSSIYFFLFVTCNYYNNKYHLLYL